MNYPDSNSHAKSDLILSNSTTCLKNSIPDHDGFVTVYRKKRFSGSKPVPTANALQSDRRSPSIESAKKNDTVRGKNYISFYYANARSLVNKLNELRFFVSTTTYDVIAITETWLSDKLFEA